MSSLLKKLLKVYWRKIIDFSGCGMYRKFSTLWGKKAYSNTEGSSHINGKAACCELYCHCMMCFVLPYILLVLHVSSG